MATKKATVEKGERTKVTIPRAHYGEEENLFVGINGVNYIVPKGKSVDVPDFVADEIERAQAAEERMHQAREQMLEEANRPLFP